MKTMFIGDHKTLHLEISGESKKAAMNYAKKIIGSLRQSDFKWRKISEWDYELESVPKEFRTPISEIALAHGSDERLSLVLLKDMVKRLSPCIRNFAARIL